MKFTVFIFGSNFKKELAAGIVCFGSQADRPDRVVNFEIMKTDMSLRDAAEYTFDLTNNPSREEEWSAICPTPTRSFSVGDVVLIEKAGEQALFLCQSFGWARVDAPNILDTIAKLRELGTWHGRGMFVNDLPACSR